MSPDWPSLELSVALVGEASGVTNRCLQPGARWNDQSLKIGTREKWDSSYGSAWNARASDLHNNNTIKHNPLSRDQTI